MISIIIPTYQPNEYLRECFESINKQTLDKKLYEIIIVLNGEVDIYLPLVNTFVAKYLTGNVVKVISTTTTGVSHARNLGLKISNGKYICFIDDDDLISSNYLESLVKPVSNDTIVVSNVLTFVDSINFTDVDYITRAFLKSTRKSIFSQRTFLSSSCCKIIPKDIIENREFNLKFRKGEDSLFMFLISDKIKHIKLATEDTIYYRRLRINSASRKKTNFISNIKNATNLSLAYSKIYINSPFKYNFYLFLSRVIASIVSISR